MDGHGLVDRLALPDEFEATLPTLSALLALGGDERIAIESGSGRNRYGTGTKPRPSELWFSSSTASPPTTFGYAAAGDALTAVLSGQTIAALADNVRARLLRLYGVPGAHCILSASGTDSELLLLALARPSKDAGATNILLGPNETGSGVPLAAAGRYYLSTTALGKLCRRGDVVSGLEGDVSVETIALRDSDGRPRGTDELEEYARRITYGAVAAKRSVILHCVDVSKTGLRGLNAESARRIRAIDPERITVVVDACQLRCSPQAIREHLSDGFAVMISGSKFAGGPAFCGALLLPPEFPVSNTDLPLGVGGLSARADWPSDLRSRCAAKLPVAANLGLTLRWIAALAEIEAYDAADPMLVEQARALFEAKVTALIARNGMLEPVGPRQDDGARTIFPVFASGSWSTPFGATTLHRSLMKPRPHHRPPCHLGQPVQIGERSAVRVCASMPMLRKIADDLAVGVSASTAGALCPDLEILFDAISSVITGREQPEALSNCRTSVVKKVA